jgi:ankyrin repeat protein
MIPPRATIRIMKTKITPSIVLMCLLMAGATVYGQQPPLYSSIHEAVEHNNIDAVKQFLQKGASVNAKGCNDMTPLLRASSSDLMCHATLEMVEFLVANGADVNAKNNFGQTVLMGTGKPGVLKFLVEKGADVNAKDQNGTTPLMCAIMDYRTEDSEYLIANGANVNAKDNEGKTAIWYAIRVNNTNLVALLKQHGATE